MKLVEIAERSIDVIKEEGEDGIRSDHLAERLETPKRRIYDVLAILKAMGKVETNRRFDGTTITWVDESDWFVEKGKYEATKEELEKVTKQKKQLQVEVAQLKQQLRIAKSKIRKDAEIQQAHDRIEFDTTQLRVRPLSNSGFKAVKDSGMEVMIECHESGFVVDPSEKQIDKNETLLRNIQRL
ncbi:MAG: hypothetical protein ACOC38_02270 [Promethearchaeia archaeon]